MNKQEALFKYILRLADNDLILGHRVSEWTGHGPMLEEDLALANIALDLIGNANSLYQYAVKVEGKGRTEDDLAYMRGERDFYNTLLAEHPNGDYACTMVRQFFTDAFYIHYYEDLKSSADATLAALAAKALKEVNYHLRHSSSWIERFGDGTEESHMRAQNAINELWRYTEELFDMNEVDAILIKEKIAVDLAPVKAKWEKTVNDVLVRSTLEKPQNVWQQRGSRDGKHTEHLGYLLAEMQHLHRAIPGANW
ncbi:MAG TPA: 1,2-phenylacetyl-CoA epoxidase subunit PaaC [Bacteroidia bacterium]|jgi:ring-1,2-phenylacetyl-CoA epoxidase subunit PaaC